MKYAIAFLLWCIAVGVFAQSTIILKENNIENAYPRLSKDGRHILYQSNRTGNWQLYTCDVTGKNNKRLISNEYNDNLPDWSYDNQWIAFVSDRDGNEEIYLAKADGTAQRRLTNNISRDIHPYFSPDGKYILFNSDREGNQFDVYRYNIANNVIERITNTPDNETCARYAPDMKSIVMLQNNDFADGVVVMRQPGTEMIDISRSPNVLHGWPMVSYDGKWVYYSSMEKGTYSIYRIKPDGSGKQQITFAKNGEEHARINISRDEVFIIYNIKSANNIAIVSEKLKV